MGKQNIRMEGQKKIHKAVYLSGKAQFPLPTSSPEKKTPSQKGPGGKKLSPSLASKAASQPGKTKTSATTKEEALAAINEWKRSEDGREVDYLQLPPGGTKKSPEQPSFRTLMAFGEKDLNRGWKANALLKAVKTVQKPPAVVKGPVLDGVRERFQQKLKLHKEWNESLFSALLKRKKSDTSDWTEEPLTVKTISQYDDFLGLYEVQTSRGCLYFCRHDSSEW